MKVILVNPVSMLTERSARIKSFLRPIPALGIVYIAAVLKESGIEAKIIDQYAQRMNNDSLIAAILRENPDIAAFSCLTPTIKNVSVLAKRIKALKPHIKIVLGNIHPTLFASEFLQAGIADVIVRGEGEYSMLDLAIGIKNNSSLGQIEGISFINDGSVYHNPDRKPIMDLDRMPYPAWDLLDLNKYDCFPLLGLKKMRFIPILGSRGCPYQCTFCAQDKIHRKIRYRKTLSIVDEMEYVHNRYGINCVVFIDPFFPFSVQHGLDFCNEVIKRGLHKKMIWIAESRVDKVNYELLSAMKKSGAYLIMYGFESGVQKVLDTLKKGYALEQSLEAMRLTKKAGIYTLGLFMVGAPGETRQDCEETIKFSKRLDCTIAKFNIVVPYPGTALFEKYRSKFDVIEDSERFMSWLDWSAEANYKGMICVSDTMPVAELVSLQRKAMFQFYARPKAMLRHIRLTSLKDLCYGGWIITKQYLKSLAKGI